MYKRVTQIVKVVMFAGNYLVFFFFGFLYFWQILKEIIFRPDDHLPKFLTDIHNPSHQTWWQSQTMFEGIQYPNQVNLTLHLGKFCVINVYFSMRI